MPDLKSVLDSAEGLIKAVPELYHDGLQETVQSTGKSVALIPRAIRAALWKQEKWIMDKEYSREAYRVTQQLMLEKLKDADPDKIVEPESYIANPALRAIADSIDSAEIRNMYANLLAKSIYEDSKESVHPAFVEIIKQMSPTDASNLSCFPPINELLPTAEYRHKALINSVKKDSSRSTGYATTYQPLLRRVFISNVNKNNLEQQAVSISNLERLGLISISFDITCGDYDYSEFEKTSLYRYYQKDLEEYNATASDDMKQVLYIKNGSVTLTQLGYSFVQVCISK